MKKSFLALIFILVSCTNQPAENQSNALTPQVDVTATANSDSEDDTVEVDAETITPTIIPNQAQISWSSIGPGGGGWLTSLAFAPPSTIYVGCDVGGVYRSTDLGESFEIINNGLQNYVIQTIAVHPDIPTTVFLGTAGGVYKSVDAGDHWEWMRNGFPPIETYGWSAPISSLAIDPNNPDIIYAGVGHTINHVLGQGVIFRSEDGGEQWSIINTGSKNIDSRAIIYSILIHPQKHDEILVSTDYGVYISMDGGINWEPRNMGLPHINTREIIIDPTNPMILYLTINSPPNVSPWQGGVYKSIDGGNSWEPKTNGLGKHVGNPGEANLITANYKNITIDHQNPDVLYVSAISWWNSGIYKTVNGGESWTNIFSRQNTDWGWINHHDWSPSHGECLLIHPDEPENVFLGQAAQLFETKNGGNTWQQIYTNETPDGTGWWKGGGLETTVVYDIEVDPSNSNIVYIGYWDTGFQKTEDEGETFKRFIEGLEHPGNIFDIEIDPEKTNEIYASSGRWEWTAGDIAKSEDSGQTWRVIGNPASGLPDSQVYDLVLDDNSPVDYRTIYAASYQNGVYKSIDSGMSWTEMNTGLGANGNLQISSLAIDPTDSNILYAGMDMNNLWKGYIQGDQHGGIYKTLDGGSSWSNLNSGIPYVLDISINPYDPQVLYAGAREYNDQVNEQSYQGGVYQSVDGGDNWLLVFEDPFVEVVEVDPYNPSVIYAGTGDHPYNDQSTGNGLFRSDDNGQSWYSVNNGLTHLSIRDLAFDPTDPAIIYLGTAGNGVFKGSVQE